MKSDLWTAGQILLWATLLLTCRMALATNGHAYEYSENGFEIWIYDPDCMFVFDDSEPRCLRQLVLYDPQHQIHGKPVIGTRLDETLRALGTVDWQDTLWSAVDIESEYSNGTPLADSRRSKSYSTDGKLQDGTLWVLSLGVGIIMDMGRVNGLALRHPDDVPTVGCGPLDDETLLAARRVRAPAAIHVAPAQRAVKSAPVVKSNRVRFALRLLLSLAAVALIVFPAVTVYRDIQGWKQSQATTGRVVETRPEGPFPDELVVEYTVGNEERPRQVVIPDTYTTARQVGDEMELLYRAEHPEKAMTRIQIRDDGLTIPPQILFGCVAAASFCLVAAFPQHLRLGRRSRN